MAEHDKSSAPHPHEKRTVDTGEITLGWKPLKVSPTPKWAPSAPNAPLEVGTAEAASREGCHVRTDVNRDSSPARVATGDRARRRRRQVERDRRSTDGRARHDLCAGSAVRSARQR